MLYDVIVIGGAMSGATLALALSRRAGKKVAVIEAFSDSSTHPGFDARSIALSYGSVQRLKSYALWDKLADAATNIDSIHISDKGHLGQTDFYASRLKKDRLGAVVELADVGAIYTQLLHQDNNIDFFCPDSIQSLVQTHDSVEVTLTSGQILTAQLLVAADGVNSKVASLLNIPNQVDDFAQHALIANVGLSRPHDNQAFERFTQHGPLALLPMSQQRMSLVWCMGKAQLDEANSLDNNEFLHRLQKSFGWRLGKFIQVGALSSYPLALHKRDRITHHRVVIVGNAAQTLHPIAGQGFNLGIRDVAHLVDTITNYEDCGAYLCLKAYREGRQADRDATCAMTSGLVRIFSNHWLPLVSARNLGLVAFDSVTPLQAPVKNRSLGLIKN